MLKILKIKRVILILYLFIFTTQFVFLEGSGVSNIKLFFMGLAPIFLLFYVPYLTRAFLFGSLYAVSILLVALSHDFIRYSTILYFIMFIFTIIFVYNLIFSNILNLEDFIKIIKRIIILFVVSLVLQQICILIGIRNFPIINLYNQNFLAIDKLPSLTLEPSHTARILTAYMFAYLKCNEFLYGRKLTFNELFTKKHIWVSIGFLWTMLTMGSGTAFIGLGILSLYFISLKTSFYVIPFMGIVFFIAANMEIKQLDRSLKVVEVTLSGDTEEIRNIDGSAATRIVPILNTFRDIDLLSKETWIGIGTTSKEYNETGWMRENVKLGSVEQYGFITYILSLIFIFKCCIRKILSIESLIFVLLLGASFSNIYYVWGIMIIFIYVKYYNDLKKNNKYE